MLKQLSNITSAVLVGVLLNACGAGSGEGLDNNGSPVSGGATPTPPPSGGDVTLSKLQSDIFTPKCAVCHAGGSAPRGLRLDSVDNSFNFMVNVAADEVPELLRVAPGNANDSYIVKKIEGASDIVGAQMPLGGPPLSNEEIAMVRQWIDEGAMVPSSSTITTKVSQLNSSTISDHVVFGISFNRALDVSTINQRAVTMYRQVAGMSQVVDFQDFEVRKNGSGIQAIFTGDTSELDGLELRINDTAGASLYDVNGFQIDGDNNQIEGGEHRYVHSF